MKRRSLAVLLAGCVMLCQTMFAQAVYPDPPKTITFVNDYAEMLKPGTETEIEKICKSYEKQTTIEMVIVTRETIQGEDPMTYATILANNWGVGKSTLNNGVFLLIAKEERKFVLKPGKGLEPYYPQEKMQSVLNDVMTPFFRQGDIDKGVLAAVKRIQSDLGDATWNMREEHSRLQQVKALQEQKMKQIEGIQERYAHVRRNVDILLDEVGKSELNVILKDSLQIMLHDVSNYQWQLSTRTPQVEVDRIDAEIGELEEILNQVSMFLDTHTRSVQIAKRKALFRKGAWYGGGSVLLIGLLLLGWWLYRRYQTVREMREGFRNELSEMYNSLLQWDAFFQGQVFLKETYPAWAIEEIKMYVATAERSLDQAYTDLNVLDETIRKKPRSIAKAFIDMAPDYCKVQECYLRVTETIPKEVRKYREQAPVLVLNLRSNYVQLMEYFKRVAQRGFAIDEYIRKLEAAEGEIITLENQLHDTAVVYRDVYTHAGELQKYLNTELKVPVEELVTAKETVDQELPNMDKYLRRVEEEYKETISVWEMMQERYDASCYQDLQERYVDVSQYLERVKTMIETARNNNTFKEQQFVIALTGMNDAKNSIEWINTFLDTIRERYHALQAAEKAVPGLYVIVKELMQKLEQKAENTDVKRATKVDIGMLLTRFNDVYVNRNINWITVQKELNAIHTKAQSLYDAVKHQIAEAKRRRDFDNTYKPLISPTVTTDWNTTTYKRSSTTSSQTYTSPFGGGKFSQDSGVVGGW